MTSVVVCIEKGVSQRKQIIKNKNFCIWNKPKKKKNKKKYNESVKKKKRNIIIRQFTFIHTIHAHVDKNMCPENCQMPDWILK